MATFTVTNAGPVITIGSLPTDGTIPKILVAIQTGPAGNRKTVLRLEKDRDDLTSPDQTVNLLDLEPSNQAILSDFDVNGMTAIGYSREILPNNKLGPSRGESPITIDPADVQAILAKYPNIQVTAPVQQNQRQNRQAGGGGGGGGGGGQQQTQHHPQGGGGGGHGGGNGGGGHSIYPPVYPPHYPPHNPPVYPPMVVNNQPDHSEGKFYAIVAVVVLAIVALIGFYCYKTPAVYKVSIDATNGMNRGALPRIGPIQTLRNIQADGHNTAIADTSHEIDTVGGLIIRPQAASVRTIQGMPAPASSDVLVQSVSYPVYMGGGSSYGATFHVRHSENICSPAPAPYCPPPAIEVTKVVSRSNGTGYALASSPRFGISNDLVERGNGFAVTHVAVEKPARIAQSVPHGSHKSGSR
jgi:hypothetical protein